MASFFLEKFVKLCALWLRTFAFRFFPAAWVLVTIFFSGNMWGASVFLREGEGRGMFFVDIKHANVLSSFFPPKKPIGQFMFPDL